MQNFPTLSDADIVPESYQMRLMAWRDEFTRGYFEIGDIANEIMLENIKRKMMVEHAQVYSAVGRFCGKSGRTVRDYAEVAAFFPEDTRKYYDVLPFSHFRFAKSCGRQWQEVLEFSLGHPDASEERLAHEFLCGGINKSVAAQENNGAGAATDAPVAELSVADSNVAVGVAAGLSGVYVIANLVSQAEVMLSWKMNKETRRKLIVALDGLKDVLKDLSLGMSTDEILKYEYFETSSNLDVS